MGEHASYIWAAYAAAGLVVGGLVAHVWADLRRQQALLEELEKRGSPRRRKPRSEPVRGGAK